MVPGDVLGDRETWLSRTVQLDLHRAGRELVRDPDTLHVHAPLFQFGERLSAELVIANLADHRSVCPK